METLVVKCRGCGSSSLVPFFNLGKQPLANSLMANNTCDPKNYDLGLSFCNACSLVQLSVDVDASEMFSNYLWKTGTSKTAREHASKVSKQLIKITNI
jgi:hypothetical protein